MLTTILALVLLAPSFAQMPAEPGPFKKPELVDLRDVDPTLWIDVRYATANNFLGRPVYPEPRAFLQRDAARALARANAALREQGFGIVVFDGYRPWSVTKLFWDETPEAKRAFVADPSKGSRHNRGAAVDVSLFEVKTGRPVEMPTGYDEFTEAASPTYQGGTPEARANRDMLRAAMEEEGFTVYENEWWHFDYKDWREYPILDASFAEIAAGTGAAGDAAAREKRRAEKAAGEERERMAKERKKKEGKKSDEKSEKREKPEKSEKSEKSDDAEAGARPQPVSARAAAAVDFLPLPKGGAKGTLNASGVVPLGDNRFLFCDNQTPDALFELRVDPSGAAPAAVVRRPIAGLPASGADDMEDVAVAVENGRRYIFVSTSLGVQGEKKGGGGAPSGGLLRIVEGEDGTLTAEMLTGFRDWLSEHSQLVADAAAKSPDVGGLNVEGMTWDPSRHALLVGLRTPQSGGKPVLLPVRVKDLAGPWAAENFEMLDPIVLDPGAADGRLGVRSIEYDERRRAFLVLLGRSTSGLKVPFGIYLWDGKEAGALRRFERAVFDEEAKPEGITAGTVGGRPALVLVDDAGGYRVLFDDDPRLQ